MSMKKVSSLLLAAMIALLVAGPVAADGGDGDDGLSVGTPNRQMQAVLDQLARLVPTPLETLTPQEARQQPTVADAVKAVLQAQGRSTAPEPVGNVQDTTIPGPAGSIPVRVYTPAGTGPFPVVVYYHGGGWVIANVDVYDSSARALTNASGAIVISVEYRQAPENPFPAAVDDAYASYIWATQNAASINGDPKRVAVAGESAGGNLATVVARRARDAGEQLPVHQLLVYPITNYNFDTPSYNQYANAKPLSKGLMQWFFSYYLRSEADGASPDVSPLRADLSGLPPATIIAAQIDPLQSEGQQYAQKLRDAGVPVTYQLFTEVTHEFFGTGAVVDKGKQAVALAGNQLRAAFGLTPLPATGADDLPLGTGVVLAGVLVTLGGALVVRTRKAQAARA